jgi:hypothetical protein
MAKSATVDQCAFDFRIGKLVGLAIGLGLLASPVRPADLLYIVGWYGATEQDSAVISLAAEMGHTVTVAPEATLADAEGKSLILISESSTYWDMPPGFKTLPIPEVVWSINAWNTLGMLKSGGGYYGEFRSDIRIVKPSHALAAGFDGDVEVCSPSAAMNFGLAVDGADIIAIEPENNLPAIFALEIGTELPGGVIVPARRVGLFLNDNTATALTPQGRTLVRTAINWGLSHAPPNFLVHPKSLRVKERQAAYFFATANGSSTMSFQWLKNGVPIPGATQAQYAAPGASLADNGAVIRCLVTNDAGRDTSAPAILSVDPRGTPNSGELISVSGNLNDAGGVPLGLAAPIARDMTVKVYAAPQGGVPVHEESFLESNGQAVQIHGGRFVIRLGSGSSQTEVQDALALHPDLYAEFMIGTPGNLQTLAPRIPITSPSQAGTHRILRGTGAPTSSAPEGTVYQDIAGTSLWLRAAHDWRKLAK